MYFRHYTLQSGPTPSVRKAKQDITGYCWTPIEPKAAWRADAARFRSLLARRSARQRHRSLRHTDEFLLKVSIGRPLRIDQQNPSISSKGDVAPRVWSEATFSKPARPTPPLSPETTAGSASLGIGEPPHNAYCVHRRSRIRRGRKDAPRDERGLLAFERRRHLRLPMTYRHNEARALSRRHAARAALTTLKTGSSSPSRTEEYPPSAAVLLPTPAWTKTWRRATQRAQCFTSNGGIALHQ